jgi:flagellar basal-body rod protein FlgB
MVQPLQPKLEHYLDLLSARQRLVAGNIANADTPGYRTRDIDFQFEFVSQVAGEPLHVIEPKGLAGKNDGNNVSLDREARLLAENALRFQFASQLMKGEFRMLKAAIQEGGK